MMGLALKGMSTNLGVALAWAAVGVRVFPCRAGDEGCGRAETPLVKWKDVATTDAATIEAWWNTWPNAMPALVTDDLLVIDCDLKPPLNGVGAFEEFSASHGFDLSTALKVRTPSGGLHLYWRMRAQPAIGNRSGGLPTDVDVRSQGEGYVIAEGATRGDGGAYQRMGGPDPRGAGRLDVLGFVPPVLVAVLSGEAGFQVPLPNANMSFPPIPAASAAAILGAVGSLDLTTAKVRYSNENVDNRELNRGLAYLDAVASELASALPGSRGSTLNRVAFTVGGACATGFIPIDVARNKLLDACERNGLVSVYGLAQVLGNIDRALGDGSRNPRPLPDRQPATTPPMAAQMAGGLALAPASGSRVSPWRWLGEAPPQPPEWLIADLFPKIGVYQLAGATGCGKSTFAMRMAAHIIEGHSFLSKAVHRRGAVLWFAAEGEGELDPRSVALQQEGVLTIPGPLAFCVSVPRLTDVNAEAQLHALIQQARRDLADAGIELDIVMIVIDTLAAAAGWADENSSAEAQSVFSMLRRVALSEGLAVLVIDHFGKGGDERGTRGSSAKDAAADVRIGLQMSGTGLGTIRLDKSRACPRGDLGTYRIEAVTIGTKPDGAPLTAAYADVLEIGASAASLSKGGREVATLATDLKKAGQAVSKGALRDAWIAKGKNVQSFGKAYKDAERAGLVPAGDLRKGDIIDLTTPDDLSACDRPSIE
jgi:hypothetical protein